MSIRISPQIIDRWNKSYAQNKGAVPPQATTDKTKAGFISALQKPALDLLKYIKGGK